MYNTKVEVKYQSIENELIDKIKTSKTENKENEYTEQEVYSICSDLYRNELLKVFELESIYNNNKMEKCFSYVLSVMIVNENFKNFLDENVEFIKNTFMYEKKEERMYDIILTFLFSQQLFYITHRCIIQQMENGFIDENLLNELRENTKKLLQEKGML